MTNNTTKYQFTANLDKYDFQKYVYTGVYLPAAIIEELARELAKYPRLRIDALVDDAFINAALIPDKVGSMQTKHLLINHPELESQRIWFLTVSSKVLKAIGKQIGEVVEVKFTIADQNYVEIPDGLNQYLNQNPSIKAKFESLTAGKKRSLVQPLLTARTKETFEKRLLVLQETLFDL